MPTLFVYGSLKKGLSNHHWMGAASFLGEAVTQPNVRMYDYGGFPALVVVAASEGSQIRGELYAVKEADLQRLDILEGVEEQLYARGEVALLSPSDVPVAVTYIYQRPVEGYPDIGEVWSEGA